MARPAFYYSVLVFVCFSYNRPLAQTIKNLTGEGINLSGSHYPKTTDREAKTLEDNFELSYCDEDGDGFMTFNVDELEQQILQLTGFGNGDTESILISTNGGQILKVTSPSSNPSITEICHNDFNYTDVAVDENGEIYKCTFSYIVQVDGNCMDAGPSLFTFEFGNGANSLSFDPLGNMYYGTEGESKVYRWDADELSPSYVWHDFSDGHAGGDFVMLNNKMYISWVVGSSYRLYEVTVDENINFVSYVDLGELPDKTYGLASELGNLYGVTPNELFRIRLDPLSFETIITNDDYVEWWGAAGLHEAVILDTSLYLSENEANNGTNALSGDWTNTVFGGEPVYARVENIINGEYVVLEVKININIVPQISPPTDLQLCTDSPSNIFDLTQVETELLEHVHEPVEITYYRSLNDAQSNLNSVETTYLSIGQENTIYVRVQNINNECFNTTHFNLIANLNPNVAPIVDENNMRYLDNCYIDRNNQGYFKLDEIYEQVVLDATQDYNLEFYHSYDDAQLGANKVDNKYFTIGNGVEELFVKVINEHQCYGITNFSIDGNCILTTTDLSGIYFPKYITPNHDGFHDNWNVGGLSEKLRKESTISIFNRYGQLLYQFNPYYNVGWDGTLNGTQLPNSDYWFRLETHEGITYNGHFSLVN